MQTYWWLMLIAAGVMFAAGAMLWTNSAATMARMVSPSTNRLEREAKLNSWGIRLMAIAAMLAILSIVIVVRY
jgi:hypothetical protein